MAQHQFTNQNIRLTLSDLRSKIRNGQVTVYYRDAGVSALVNAVARAFDLKDLSNFDKTNFNPQTLRRFDTLFNVPTYAYPSQSPPYKLEESRYPTQDDTATALQNFINRRSDPWAHVRQESPILDLDAEGQGVSV